MTVQTDDVLVFLRQAGMFPASLPASEVQYCEERVKYFVEDFFQGRHDEVITTSVVHSVVTDELEEMADGLRNNPPANMSKAQVRRELEQIKTLLGLIQFHGVISPMVDKLGNTSGLKREELIDDGFSGQTADDIVAGKMTIGQVLLAEPQALLKPIFEI